MQVDTIALQSVINEWSSIPLASDTSEDGLEELDKRMNEWFARLEKAFDELVKDIERLERKVLTK